MDKTILVAGGGWAGCAATLAAKKQGFNVILFERTDLLLGTGLVGGIMRNNGRFTAAEELIAMGGGELLQVCDCTARHTNVTFPGHEHASLYDIAKTPIAVKDCLEQHGVDIRFNVRITDVKMEENCIVALLLENGDVVNGDVIIDTTGTAGPMNNCIKYGNGCAMCILRCPSFGGRVSIAEKAGIAEKVAKREDGKWGAMSGSCKLYKESLSKDIQKELNDKGVAIIPIPQKLRKDVLALKACQQYALSAFKDNIILLDTGHAKLMSPYFELSALHQITGFEQARYEDPYAGGKGNSMRCFAMAPRENTLKVKGCDNLLCAGEKAGPLVGHTEAIVTGTLAGYNAAKMLQGKDLLEMPVDLCSGDAINYVGKKMETDEGISKKYTFSGSVYFDRMKRKQLYTTDISTIRNRVERAGMIGIFKTVP